jgi:hypothetical protein
MGIYSALESAECAKINLENMVKMMPTLALHPLLPVVRIQIDECVKALEAEMERIDE